LHPLRLRADILLASTALLLLAHTLWFALRYDSFSGGIIGVANTVAFVAALPATALLALPWRLMPQHPRAAPLLIVATIPVAILLFAAIALHLSAALPIWLVASPDSPMAGLSILAGRAVGHLALAGALFTWGAATFVLCRLAFTLRRSKAVLAVITPCIAVAAFMAFSGVILSL
jgi:hypothetical protein